jgi:RecA-family ATPase
MNGHAVDEPPPATGPEDYGTAVPATIDERPLSLAPAVLTTPAQWPQEAPPPVDWLVAGRIPRGDVTTLHGDGGAGKTDIALRLAANVARGAVDWFGQEIANGPVVLVSAEEPEREVRRRIWQHGLRDGYTFDDLAELRQWFPDKTGDAVLATPDHRTGIMRPTRLMHSIAAAIENAAPVLVVVDNVAAVFAGNQNDRVMVRSFVNLWRTIAHGPSKPAVLLLDHPSLSHQRHRPRRQHGLAQRRPISALSADCRGQGRSQSRHSPARDCQKQLWPARQSAPPAMGRWRIATRARAYIAAPAR